MQVNDDLKSLSFEDKVLFIKEMIGDTPVHKLALACALFGFEPEQDNQGQLLVYTELMFNEKREVVPFVMEVSDDDIYETEEEVENEECPPTTKCPVFVPPSVKPRSVR